jgi:hypothetical protein
MLLNNSDVEFHADICILPLQINEFVIKWKIIKCTVSAWIILPQCNIKGAIKGSDGLVVKVSAS